MSLTGKNNGHILVGSINKCDLLTITAYGIAVKNGYEGTEEEWLLSLQGGVYVDKTLKIDGVAADSKATGDAIKANTTAINEVKTSVDNVPNLINNHVADNLNPHKVTAKQVGLDKVNNTADLDKPVSTAQSTAIAEAKKAGTDAHSAANNAQTTADEAHTAIDNHKEDKNNPHEVTAAQVGATSMNLLWENASPTSSFEPQNIAVPVSAYDYIMVEGLNSANWNGLAHASSRSGYHGTIQNGNTTRAVKVFDSYVQFFNGKDLDTGAVGGDKMIPQKIWGIKGVIE